MKGLRLSGLTKRWVFNVLSVVFVIILMLEFVFTYVIHKYYYSTVEQYLYNQMDAVASSFSAYSAGSYSDFESGARQYVENFAQRDSMEVQILNSNGKVIMSTSGFMPGAENEYKNAVTNENGMTSWRGKLSTGEDVMTVSTMVTSPQSRNINIGGIRIIVSLADTNKQYFLTLSIGIVFGLAMFLILMLSSVYFIRSIIMPVGRISETARQIASGDFEARIEPQKRDDEIGKLCDTINYMASELASTEKMKNEFISSVSHELRTPLTAIKGWGETVLSSVDDPEIAKKGIDVIISEAERLSVIVEDLLDFSRLQSGNLKFNMQPCDVVAELSEAVLTLTDTARKNGVNLDYTEPVGIPAITGDPGRLQQVFVNIIDNAIKYTPAGGHIVVDMKLESGHVLILISDTGCGIPEQDLDKVKQKFYKAEGAVRGSGIGLAIADEIVSSHGGMLDISSTEHVGTTVSILLPLKQKNE